MSSVLRSLAEHEAAHAVVARHLGHVVTEIRIDSSTRSGATTWDATHATRQHEAAVKSAGDVWASELGSVEYVDLACRDLATFEQQFGLERLWQARRNALAVLLTRRRSVLVLADRLVRERVITIEQR